MTQENAIILKLHFHIAMSPYDRESHQSQGDCLSFPAAPSGISQLSTLSPLIFFETRVCHHITCLPCIHPPPPPPHLVNLLKPCSSSYHLCPIQFLPHLVSWWSVVEVAGILQSSGHQQYLASRLLSPEPLTHLLLACWGIRWTWTTHYCHIYSKGRNIFVDGWICSKNSASILSFDLANIRG